MSDHITTRKIMFELIKLLQAETDEEHGLYLEDIAQILQDRLGVTHSRKTLRLELEELCHSGFPIEYSKGWFYRHELKPIELDYLCLLVSGATGLSETDRSHLLEQLGKFGGKYYEPPKMTNHRPGNEQFMITLSAIQEAIRLGFQVELNYGIWKSDKQLHDRLTRGHNIKCYQVTPWALVPHNGRIYFVGYYNRHSSPIHFRTDRILNIRLLRKPGVVSKVYGRGNIDPGEYSVKHPFMFSGKLHHYRITLNKAVLNDVLDNFGTDIVVIPGTDKYLDVIVECDIKSLSAWMRRYEDQFVNVVPETDMPPAPK